MEIQKSGIGRKIAISSISLLVMTHSAIAVIMNDMREAFPHVDPTSIQSFLTIASGSVMVFTLLSGIAAGVVGKRRLLLIGLVVYTLGGIAPIFLTDFSLLMVSRVVMGAGIGLVNPIAASLIADFYEGSERAQLMGFKATAGSLGQTVTTFLAGVLAVYGWQNVFWIYLLGVVIFIICFCTIPEPPAVQAEGKGPKRSDAYKISGGVIVVALWMGIYFIAYMAIMTNFAIVAAETGVENQTLIGTAISIMTACSMIMAVLFGNAFKLLKNAIAIVGALLFASGLVILANAQSMTVMILAMIMFGIGNGCCVPFAYNCLAVFSPKTSVTFCMSIMLIGVNVGSLVSPYVMTALAGMFGINDGRFKFLIAAVLYGVLALMVLYYTFSTGRKKTGMESGGKN